MEKKIINYFKIVMIILFVIFIAYYIALENGYYESKLRDKTIMTEEQIARFETDIKNGVDVTINDYLVETPVTTNNGISKAGLAISTKTEEIIIGSTKWFLNIFNYLFGI